MIEVPRSALESDVPLPGSDSVEELGSSATVDEGSSATVEEFDMSATHEHEGLHASSEVADESRIAVLKEMGIDPDAALQAYQRERDRCDGCAAQVPEAELEESLGGRLCRECQAEDVSAKPQGDPDETPREQLAAVEAKAPDAGKVVLYGALFFFGFLGLGYTVSSLMWHPSWLVSIALALVVAGFGSHRVSVAH